MQSFGIHYLKDSKESFKQLLFPLKKDSELAGSVALEGYTEEGLPFQLLRVNMKELKKDPSYNEFSQLYFRFRIKTVNLKNMLFCRLHKRNWFLESGFVATQIVDLKINKERNLPSELIHRLMILEGYRFMEFDKIHFLVMDEASDQVKILSNYFAECRKLEEKDWNEYLNHEYDTKEVLVYHFKQKSSNEERAREFSGLIRISTPTSNRKIIFVYLMMMTFIGIVGGLAGAEISRVFGWLWAYLLH